MLPTTPHPSISPWERRFSTNIEAIYELYFSLLFSSVFARLNCYNVISCKSELCRISFSRKTVAGKPVTIFLNRGVKLRKIRGKQKFFPRKIQTKSIHLSSSYFAHSHYISLPCVTFFPLIYKKRCSDEIIRDLYTAIGVRTTYSSKFFRQGIKKARICGLVWLAEQRL